MEINVVRAYVVGMRMKESYGGWLWMVWIVFWFAGLFIFGAEERIVIWPMYMWHWYTWLFVAGFTIAIAIPLIGKKIMDRYENEISRSMITDTNGCRIIQALDKNQPDGKWLWYNFKPPVDHWAKEYPWKYHINNKEVLN